MLEADSGVVPGELELQPSWRSRDMCHYHTLSGSSKVALQPTLLPKLEIELDANLCAQR